MAQKLPQLMDNSGNVFISFCLSLLNIWKIAVQSTHWDFFPKFLSLHYYTTLDSAVASGWAGWALAHPEFGISVNPIPTGKADYAHHITACPPGFENLTASM